MNLIKLIIGLGLLLFSLIILAQEKTPLELMVEGAKEKRGSFKLHSNIFKSNYTAERTQFSDKFIDNREVVYLDYSAAKILGIDLKFFSLEIPKTTGSILIDLVEVPDSFYDYEVTTSSGKHNTGHDFTGKHYRGVVRGEERSLAAISFFENKVMGVISISGEGNYNLGKLKDSDIHIFYSDKNLKESFNFECGTQSGFLPDYRPEQLFHSDRTISADKCVKLYFETEYDIYQHFENDLVATQEYVLGLYNQVATFFQNENITIELSSIKIWEEEDPYISDDKGILLEEFQEERTDFDGDLGQLLTFRVSGGRAAGGSGLCNPVTAEKLAVSGVKAENEDILSQTVAHEFGHLLGSRHTHACVWNENNDTAIDGCKAPEGECEIGPIPTEGGTIMSYCYLLPDIGRNLSLGFGIQPGDLIRANVADAACLTACVSCMDTLLLFVEVYNGNTSTQEASLNITATNTINSGATAIYHAGESLLLRDSFYVLDGSVFRGYIEDCTGNFAARYTEKSLSQEAVTIEESFSVDFSIDIYPNPNNGIFTLVTKGNLGAFSVEIYSFDGRRIFLLPVESATEVNLDITRQLSGIYLVKVVTENGGIYTKKVIKI